MILATLTPTLDPGNTTTLDCGFSYEPYDPKKRISVQMTSNGSFSQHSLPLIIHGKEYINWAISRVTGPIALEMQTLYNIDDTFTFTGGYGEDYLVEFSELERDREGGVWGLKGKFRVLCVITDDTADFQCPE